MRASRACESCAKSKIRCEDARPCKRCIREGCKDECKDRPVAPRKKPRRFRHVSCYEGLIQHARPRLICFEKYESFMNTFAKDISPFAWMDLLLEAPLIKLKAFGVLVNLFLTPIGFKQLLLYQCSCCFVVNEAVERVLRRILLVCDFPIVPLPPVPGVVAEDDDLQSASSIVEFHPPAENEERVKAIFEQFEFKNLPTSCDFDRPAMLLCDIDIDHNLNTIRTCAYLNEQGERLWGYSSRELYNVSTIRDIEAYTILKRKIFPSIHL
jgi:hypothetical protein